MTIGQQRALKELKRLHAVDPAGFEIIASIKADDGWLKVVFSVRLGLIESHAGGLRLREREEFVLLVPPDFPFGIPGLVVPHDRFANFPHVVWSRTICLYQSKLEWNPADGLFGFFDRLKKWLGKAAKNEMDPVDGPLEPPHHITDFSQLPFVIRRNAPVAAGESWFGLAEITKHPNRMELVEWHDAGSAWPVNTKLAPAIVLPKALPMEFPRKASEFFAELHKQGFDRNRVIRNLAIAALFADDEEPIHLILGIPMRRAADGSLRLHISVWTTASILSKTLRSTLPKETDTEDLLSLRSELSDKLYEVIAEMSISWCHVLEDRSEIVVRRDDATPAAWLRKKKVLILGCGALGSWIAESAARAGASLIHLVDNSIVKPGLLVRQNYRADDIGFGKAEALRVRLVEIDNRISVDAIRGDAYEFVHLPASRFHDYDLVLDCTASTIFQMKLERNWQIFARQTPAVISLIIDATAQSCLGVVIPGNSRSGPWDAYMQLKRQLCLNGSYSDIVRAFYSDQVSENLFQPEPGCSDPTFSGSATDVLGLACTSLNIALASLNRGAMPSGTVFSIRGGGLPRSDAHVINLTQMREIQVGDYRIRIAPNVFTDARGWVRQNNRLRSRNTETGGLLWGYWDDAVGVIWVFDISGPPPDSLHDAGHFICGKQGTTEEHLRRIATTHGTCGFIGFWHTHPDMASHQSGVDILGMGGLVAGIGENQRRALMLIFGRIAKRPTAGIYVYESDSISKRREQISIQMGQLVLRATVV